MGSEYSNKEKSQHGRYLQTSIKNLLEIYQKNGLLEYVTNYRIGLTGYKNQKQFQSPIKIKFNNGDSWLIFTTTSFRTDRFKGNEWDAYNLKKIDDDIKRVYLVYPDALEKSKQEDFEKHDREIVKSEVFSCFDRLIPQWEFANFLENEISREYNVGKRTDFYGRNFEKRILFILNNQANLEKWKTGKRSIEGYSFDVFSMIVNALNIDNIVKIEADDDIPRLPSGGKPKTDILITIEDSEGNIKKRTLSLKRSSSSRVTVHEYSADVFADVLDSKNERLRKLLNDFQKVGNLRDFKQARENNNEDLTLELHPYVDKLAMWVLSGEGGSISDDSQIAQYILTFSSENGSINIYPIKEYYRKLKENIEPNFFGTVFSWTYPSGGKGRKIQLKLPIIHDF